MAFSRRLQLANLHSQLRHFSTSYTCLAEPSSKPSPPTSVPPVARPVSAGEEPLAEAPRGYGKRVEEFTPKPLPRPIGLANPPQPGENTGIDFRSLKQRRDDFVNYDKHLVRRQQLKSKMARPYFRDWSNMQFHRGKTFISPPRLFKSDLSLYFPNLFGETLEKTDSGPRDTTTALQGKVSVVTVFSSVWAENQAATFVGKKENPALLDIIDDNKEVAQLVQINVEDNTGKYWLIRLFMSGLRKKIGESNWARYFIVRRGLSDDIKEAIGVLNNRVGYTYLLDGDCRIRWAGSGPSEDHERDGLVKGLQRLIDEAKAESQGPSSDRPNIQKTA